MQEKGYTFKARLIGNSADYSIEEINDIIDENNLRKRILSVGPKYNEEKYKELACSDVLVFPSLNEAFSLVCLEAMQAGLSVITSNVGALTDMIEHNKNGIVLEEVSLTLLLEAMEFYLNNPNKIDLHGENNRIKFKEKYTLDIFERDFVKIIHKINV